MRVTGHWQLALAAYARANSEVSTGSNPEPNSRMPLTMVVPDPGRWSGYNFERARAHARAAFASQSIRVGPIGTGACSASGASSPLAAPLQIEPGLAHATRAKKAPRHSPGHQLASWQRPAAAPGQTRRRRPGVREPPSQAAGGLGPCQRTGAVIATVVPSQTIIGRLGWMVHSQLEPPRGGFV